jgi:carbonic anhydrase
MKKSSYLVASLAGLLAFSVQARDASHGAHASHGATEADIVRQNAMLSVNTDGKGFGPQSPRDINAKTGSNQRIFATAPSYKQMNLCNIHFHKNAEHKGGEFTKYVGPGDGHGYLSGYAYSGKLSAAEAKPLAAEVCKSSHGGLQAGDTIEVHYVHSSAQVKPGETLGACLSDSDKNPQLRVEAQVFVLVNNAKAADFAKLMQIGEVKGYHQALHIPSNTGVPVHYAGSTTGPSYNEKGSPFQVSWSVRPKVMKVSAESVGQWCKGNVFKEDHAHGVRNLVTNETLLSAIR